MICPLIELSFRIAKPGILLFDTECLKEECAWWYAENQACAMLTLAQGSTYIHKELLAIRDKMPHEEQFRR